jgi:hypothetical protein
MSCLPRDKNSITTTQSAEPKAGCGAVAPGFPWGRELLALVAILLLALVLRTGWPTLAEFKFDEARLTTLALDLTREGRLPLAGLPSSAGFDHSPVSVYLYAPVFLLTSSPLFATVYSGLLGVAAVGLAWWLARCWAGSGPWAHGVAALLLAASPWLVVFNRKVWQIALVPALALVFIGLVVSSLVEGRRRHLAWAVVAYALLVQVHPSAVSLAPAFLLWLVLFRRQVKAAFLALGALLGGATAIPYLIHQLREGWPLVAALQALPAAVTDLEAVRLAAKAVTGSDIYALAGDAYPLLEIVPQLARTFHLAAALLVGALAILAWRLVSTWRAPGTEENRAARVDFVLVSWLVVPVLVNLRHSLDLYLHSFAFVVPAAYLVVGRGMDAVARAGWLQAVRMPRWVPKVGLASVGVLVTLQVVALVLMAGFVAGGNTPGGFGRPLGQTLAVAERAVDVVNGGDAAEVIVAGSGHSPVSDATAAIFGAVLRGQAPFRFVDQGVVAVFPRHHAVVLIAPDTGHGLELYESWPVEELEGGYRLVHLDGSWPGSGFEAIHGPRTFENGVELQGYRWEGRAVPGGEVTLWLLWKVLWLDAGSTHFFVHVADDQNRHVGQQDIDGYPAACRRPGDRIITRLLVSLAEGAGPGPYSAKVGTYRYPEVTNLSLLDEAGNRAGEAIVIDVDISLVDQGENKQ